MQAQLTNVLGLHHSKTKVSIEAISSSIRGNNTKMAYKKLCENLHQIGITSEMMSRKKKEILEIIKPQVTVIGGHESNIADQNQLPTVSDFSSVNLFLLEYINIK